MPIPKEPKIRHVINAHLNSLRNLSFLNLGSLIRGFLSLIFLTLTINWFLTGITKNITKRGQSGKLIAPSSACQAVQEALRKKEVPADERLIRLDGSQIIEYDSFNIFVYIFL